MQSLRQAGEWQTVPGLRLSTHLRDDADVLAQTAHGNVFDVLAVHPHTTLLGVEKAIQQSENSRFATKTAWKAGSEWNHKNHERG